MEEKEKKGEKAIFRRSVSPVVCPPVQDQGEERSKRLPQILKNIAISEAGAATEERADRRNAPPLPLRSPDRTCERRAICVLRAELF